MTVRLAVDPGDVHVGWALGAEGDGPERVTTGEWTPRECLRAVRELCSEGWVDEVVIEEFALYPGRAAEQAGSSMRTSQLIGAIKLVCDETGVGWHEQGAYIKKSTRAQLKARGIGLGKGSIHAKDAWLHYWHRTLRARAKAKEKEES